MLKTILSISGKPGLYKLISQGKNMLIVESLVDKKRFPAYGNEKIISLGDIAMYTDTEEVPLKDVLLSMKKKENGAAVALDVKKASVKELQAYLAAVLPKPAIRYFIFIYLALMIIQIKREERGLSQLSADMKSASSALIRVPEYLVCLLRKR